MLIMCSGGNDPAVVFPDVDVGKVAEKVTLHSRLKSEPNTDKMTGGFLRLPELGSDLPQPQAHLRPRVHLQRVPRRHGQACQGLRSRRWLQGGHQPWSPAKLDAVQPRQDLL